MKKNYFFLVFALVFFAGKSMAQTIFPCYTDEMFRQAKLRNPIIADNEKKLTAEINAYYQAHKDASNTKLGRKTATSDADTGFYDVPVVVHIMHNYGSELLPDDSVYLLIQDLNRFYSLKNDTSQVVSEFKQYVGKANIRFHLATKDPNGNPTKGITHRFTYLTYGGDDQDKMDQWPPASYLNIWFQNVIGAKIVGGVIVAYTELPSAAAAEPWWDGIISNYSFIGDAFDPESSGGSIDHEVGHYFNLYHTFGTTNNPGTNKSGACTQDDDVDDTPPTDGCLGCCNLFDTVCSQNYFKIYTNISGGDSLVNYPDTANEQNIMNYADCKYMFTKGQVQRMHATINSDVAKRDSIWSPFNLYNTGALETVDLAPITDFSVQSGVANTNTYFLCSGTGAAPVTFASRCWNDTVTSVTWTFNNFTPAIATQTNTQTPVQVTKGGNAASTVSNTFGAGGGWLDFTLSATGNNTGTTVTDYKRSVFVADAVATPASGYYMEFNTPDTAKWPMFNYYNNEFYWQMANVGFDDHNSIEYVGYDQRISPVTGSPLGDFDDFFSMPMDFTSFGTGACNLNFYYSGASRTSNSYDLNDTLEIDYSKDKGKTWTMLDIMSKGTLDNKGAVSVPYVPASMSDWAPMSIVLPAAAKTDYTVFRFRYRPGVILGAGGVYEIDPEGIPGSIYSSSNNFYLDRINFSAIPASVSNTMKDNMDVAIAPNPTTGNAYVIIKDADYATAKIIVSDITGKQVYTITQQMNGKEASIEIPQSAIAVKGIYMVQTFTGNQATTRKLVVY